MKIKNIIKAELYKINIKNYLIVLFFLVLITELTIFHIGMDISTFSNPISESIYQNEIHNMQGKLSEEKQRHIYELIDKSMNDIDAIKESYDNPLYLRKLVSKNPQVFEENDVYRLLESQTKYIEEDHNRRYYVDSKPWMKVMNDSGFEVSVILFTIFSSTLIFAKEYSSGMNLLNKSTYLGRTIRHFIEIAILSCTSLLLMTLIRFGKMYMLFDALKNTFNYPIQSIPTFGNALFDISIFQGFILLLFFFWIGIIYLVLIISIITKLIKSSTVSFLMSAIIVFLPFFIFGRGFLYHYPLPSSWLLGVGLFRGPEAVNISQASFLRPFYFRDFLNLSALTSLIILVLILIVIVFERRGELK